MKKTLCVVMLLLVVSMNIFVVGSAQEEESPSGLIARKYKNTSSVKNDVPADNSPLITPTWENGVCTFIDPDGIRVYAYVPYTPSIVPYGRVLISEESMPLPEGGMYYERLYTSKSTTAFKFKKYMTNAWAKADNYTVTSSTTVNWSHSGSLDLTLKKVVVAHYGLSYSKSTQSSIGTSIPADPSKYSKLGLYVKYIHNDISFQEYVVRNGATVRNDWTYGKTDNPHDYLLKPTYK
ncbi:MAG TPA: hypothetical protein IAA59_08915 [Candidatus Faecaligallichristensenella faecipullorum]|nr:hypothetical protein [Candidatus Faecaligallichristensenella faecipullorum]